VSSMTSSDSGTESNLLSGTKPGAMKEKPAPDDLRGWDYNLLRLDPLGQPKFIRPRSS
jgi:hypothetical protein